MLLFIKSYVIKWVQFFLGPSFCLHCHVETEISILCDSCNVKVQKIAPIDFKVGKYTVPVHAFSVYDNPLKKILLSKHYHDVASLDKMFDHVAQQDQVLDCLQIDTIVPVPLHWTRYARRGFNQADMLAEKIGFKIQAPILQCLKRSKSTQYQFNLSPVQRTANVQGAFSLINEDMSLQIKDKHILIVDDLYTTGSTVASICNILMQYKPASLKVFVVCRAV